MQVAAVITKPYELVEAVFASASADAQASAEGWLGQVKSAFQAALASDDKLAQVPVLTSGSMSSGRIAPDSLVRVVGMVQDVFDPEFYRAVGKGRHGAAAVPLAFRDYYASQHSHVDHMCDEEDDDGGYGAEGLAERTTLCLVPLPGQSSWASDAFASAGASSTPALVSNAGADAASRKRRREEASMEDNEDAGGAASSSALTGADAAVSSKRLRGAEDATGDTMADSEGGASSASSSSALPVPSGVDAAAPPMTLVRVYGSKCSFNVGDVVEYIGVYTMDLEAAKPGGLEGEGNGVEGTASTANVLFNQDDGFMADYAAAHCPDPFKVPRVHALLARAVPRTGPALAPPSASSSSSAPLDAFVFKPAGGEAPAGESSSTPATSVSEALSALATRELASSGLTPDVAAGIRSALIRHLSTFLGGDSLAAEYLLTALVSHASTASTKAGRRVGDLTLHLSHWSLEDAAPAAPAAAAGGAATGAAAEAPVEVPLSAVPSYAGASVADLASALAHLWPRVTLLPLALPVINGSAFAPKRDAATERLSPALLRVAPGTLLLIDETPVVAGTVTEAGVQNLQALRRVAEDRELPYLFPFMPPVPFPLDAPVVFVTRGNRSVLDAAGTVKLPMALPASGSHLPPPASPPFIGPFPIDLVRRYLACAGALSCNVPASLSDSFTEALLKWMKVQPGRCGYEELDAVATLARCLAATYGEAELSLRRLQEAIALDAARTARVAAVAPEGPVIATPPPSSPAPLAL